MEALYGKKHLAWLLAESDHKPASERLCQKISRAVDTEEHSTIGLAGYYALATAGRFVDHYSGFVGSMDFDPTGEYEALDIFDGDNEQLISHACTVLEMIDRLRDLDLLDGAAVPEGEDASRFAAHLYAKANPSVDYSSVEFDHTDVIRLLDEHYLQVEQIIGWVADEEMAAAQIRALLTGEASPVFSSGVL